MSLVMVQKNQIQPAERRSSKRYAIRVPVMVRVGGCETAHMTVNASAGGLLIRPIVEGTEPTGAVQVDVGTFALDVAAVIIGHRGEGSALQFADPAVGEQIALAVAEQAQRSG
jgi:hypothetical protein